MFLHTQQDRAARRASGSQETQGIRQSEPHSASNPANSRARSVEKCAAWPQVWKATVMAPDSRQLSEATASEQQSNPHGDALDENGMPNDPTLVAENVVDAIADRTQGWAPPFYWETHLAPRLHRV